MAKLELSAELAKLLEQRVHLKGSSTSTGTLCGGQPGSNSKGLVCLPLNLLQNS